MWHVNEGWHNRSRQVVGKDHPDLYSALLEFRKEQEYTEICSQELAVGKKVKSGPTKKMARSANTLGGHSYGVYLGNLTHNNIVTLYTS